MAGAWFPGAEHVRASLDGGRPAGGAPRVVWLTTGSDPRETPAVSAACHLDRVGFAVHLVWNPLGGEVVQMLPATRAARALQDGVGGLELNREGRICLQIQVVGYAQCPFTEGPLRGLAGILRWLDSWRVPRRWPAGAPLAEPVCRDAARERARWSRGGHFGHSQVPGNTDPDPGAVDIVKLTA